MRSLRFGYGGMRDEKEEEKGRRSEKWGWLGVCNGEK